MQGKKERKKESTARDRFHPIPKPTEGSSSEAITKADVVGGWCQRRVDVRVCRVFLVVFFHSLSVVRGDVSLCVGGRCV